MSITLDFAPADMAIIEQQAAAAKQSIERFIIEAAAKSARNAAYLAKIDRGIKQMHEGTGTLITDAQLEALANGDAI